MIDLTVMRYLLAALIGLIGLMTRNAYFQQSIAVIEVTTLHPGAILQGVVPIHGTVGTDQFSGYEISFSYTEDTTGTWFLINQDNQPVQDGTLASWDTTLITDGDYRLRVQVKFADGTTDEYLVPDLQVRNYTPSEQITATPDVQSPTAQFTAIPLQSSPTDGGVTSTPFKNNPGSLTQNDFRKIILLGAGFSGILFLIFGLYLAIFKGSRHS